MNVTPPQLEVILGPAELPMLARRNLAGSVCIVFDILRATTSMVTALAHGAQAIWPVSEIADALALRGRRPSALLAGEREGLRITAEMTGGVEFDLGNSPREFLPETVRDRSIIMTTTNGTRALRACVGARQVLIGSFLNLRATAHHIAFAPPAHLLLVCAGTHDEPALEDILAAGALCEKIWPHYSQGSVSDGAEVARRLFSLLGSNLLEAMKSARNGRRLLSLPELKDDVWFCVQRETLPFVAGMNEEGAVVRLS